MKHANGHCHRSTSLPSDLLRQLLFLRTPPQSGPPLETLVPDCRLSADSQLPWGRGGHYLHFTCPPPPAQARPVPPRRCSLRLLLIVSVSGCKCATWWRVTFGRSDACRLLSPRQNGSGNWVTEEKSRCLLWGAGTKAGTHNGFSVRSRRSVVLIKGHKRLNGCKVCKRRVVVVASGGNGGLTSRRELQRSPRPQCNTFNSSCLVVSFYHSLYT